MANFLQEFIETAAIFASDLHVAFQTKLEDSNCLMLWKQQGDDWARNAFQEWKSADTLRRLQSHGGNKFCHAPSDHRSFQKFELAYLPSIQMRDECISQSSDDCSSPEKVIVLQIGVGYSGYFVEISRTLFLKASEVCIVF